MPSSGVLIETESRPAAASGSLPDGYGETMAALMPRDPDWMFLYWELAEDASARIIREHGPDIFSNSRHVVRVYDASPADGVAARYMDVTVLFEARSWYLPARDRGRAYCCELGLVPPSGEFIGIVKSNTVLMPEGRVSDASDERWMAVSPDFDKLMQLSGVEYIGKGSGEVAKSLAQRWEMLRSVFSRASSWGVSSLSSAAREKPAQKKFWLAADCELILYGATHPDALVDVAGRKIKLNTDGTFSLRFALRDGFTDLPVTALSKDELDSSAVNISVSRRTA